MISTLFAAALSVSFAENMLIGDFTNEEQVYFDKEAGTAPPPWLGLRVVQKGGGFILDEVDAFGQKSGIERPFTIEKQGKRIVLRFGDCQRYFVKDGAALVADDARGACTPETNVTRIAAEGITFGATAGQAQILRRARPVTCWAAVPKEAKKADGSVDWFFAQDVKIHDQGGRAVVGKDVAGLKPLIIRMRNVVWPAGNRNRPSLVLYVHTPDEPDKAVSYVWADPEAKRIGINLRWMQASCTVDGTEKPTP
jgi:hypothetical protein